MTALNVYNWNQIRAALRLLQEVFPGFLENVVLIGGGACWFYREALRQWQDPDYPVPLWTEAEEAVWLSKDVDFMGLDREEASQLLVQTKERPQDRLHQRLLVEFLKCEFCREIENASALNPARWVGRARAVKSAALRFFSSDARLAGRLRAGIERLTAPEHNAIHHWAKHHLRPPA